jgi:Polysaccharide biosynthesis protein.
MKRDEIKSFNGSLEKIAGGSSLIAIGMLLSRLFEYLYKMIISRIGVAEFGIMSLGLAIFGFVSTIAHMGIHNGIRRYVPFLRGKSDLANLSGIVTFAFRFIAVSSLVFMLIAMLFAKPIAKHLLHDGRLAYLVLILFLALPFYNLKNVLIRILLSFERVKYRIYTYNIIEPASKALFAFIFVALGWGMSGVFWAYTLSMVVVFLAALFFAEF